MYNCRDPYQSGEPCPNLNLPTPATPALVPALSDSAGDFQTFSLLFSPARALPTIVSVRLKYMQDEFIAAANLPDVVDFAPDSLHVLPRWLAQLAERGDDLSADAQRDLLRHYAAACPARTSLALIKAKQRDASAPREEVVQMLAGPVQVDIVREARLRRLEATTSGRGTSPGENS
eukprot:COSAG05_NODE_1015_length_6188_cov_162.395139_3_plen_176_part_00